MRTPSETILQQQRLRCCSTVMPFAGSEGDMSLILNLPGLFYPVRLLMVATTFCLSLSCVATRGHCSSLCRQPACVRLAADIVAQTQLPKGQHSYGVVCRHGAICIVLCVY
jgi:hypothetical protein